MPTTDTRKYRTFLTRCFSHMLSTNTTQMYLAIGRLLSWTEEGNPPTPNTSTQTVDFDVWRDMLAAKRIDSANTSYVIPRRDWASDTVYTQYDDTVQNIANSNIYVLDTQTLPYRVYKCLWNNRGANSTVAPSTTGNTVSPVATADGYVWQYMYAIRTDDYQFLTDSWMPVRSDNLVISYAQSNAGKLSTVVPLMLTSNGGGFNDTAAVSTFTITLTGDGNGAVINAATDVTFTSNTITKVLLSNGGIGYTQTDTVVIQQTGATANAEGRIIIPPYPNHGYDPQTELGGAGFMLTTVLQDDELDKLTTVNDYRRILLLADPTDATTNATANASFYRQTFDLYLDSNTGVFQTDESIYVSNNDDYEVTGTVVDVITTNLESGITALVRVANVSDKGRSVAFQAGDEITSANVEGTIGVVSRVDVPELRPFTGSVLYIDQREAVTRHPNQSEEIKLVFRFD